MSTVEKIQKRGSRREVWNGSAKMTSGGLTKADLMQKPNGSIVSRRKSAQSKKLFSSNAEIRSSFEAHQFQKGHTSR